MSDALASPTLRLHEGAMETRKVEKGVWRNEMMGYGGAAVVVRGRRAVEVEASQARTTGQSPEKPKG